MKKIGKLFITGLLFLLFTSTQAANVLDSNWSDVARGRCSDQNSAWWSSAEAIRIAENVLLYQRDVGGWEKNIYDLHQPLSQSEKNTLLAKKSNGSGCTIDNGAVYYELTYLSKVYGAISDETVKSNIYNGFVKAIEYLLEAQYENGGWPQFYPLKGGYADHITYNDDAMVNVLDMLFDVYTQSRTFSFKLNDEMVAKAKAAYEKGIDCILKTQYVQNGLLTSWCAQHHYRTLEPAMARSYELASLSGMESEGILSLLMSMNDPSDDIMRAIYMGARWYDNVKITGQRLEDFTNTSGQSDKRIVMDENASDMWARFYTLENSTPFFCDRDGIPKGSIAEIGHERRNGYSWYNTSGATVKSSFASWKRKYLTTYVAYPIPDAEFDVKDSIRLITSSYKYRYTLESFDVLIDGEVAFSFNKEDVDTVFTGLRGGTHQIIALAKYNNDYVSSDTTYVTITGDNVGVNDVIQSKLATVYPNPANQEFQLDLTQVGNARVEIFDLSGKSVYNAYKPQGLHRINIQSLKAGQYLVQITGDNTPRHTVKLMVQ